MTYASPGSAPSPMPTSGKMWQIDPRNAVTVTSQISKGKKKMGWLKRKFAQWSREAWENSHDDAPVRAHDSINSKTSVRFTVYPASGGFVIEHYKQDRYKDNDGPDLTIVNTGESLGTAVEHILTLEALKA